MRQDFCESVYLSYYKFGYPTFAGIGVLISDIIRFWVLSFGTFKMHHCMGILVRGKKQRVISIDKLDQIATWSAISVRNALIGVHYVLFCSAFSSFILQY